MKAVLRKESDGRTTIRIGSTQQPLVGVEGWSRGERLNIAADGKRFRCKFIEPGLVSYIDAGADGLELLTQDAIEEGLNSFIGQPVISRHVTTLRPVPKQREQGAVDRVGRDPEDGWYWCEGTVDGADVRRDILNGLAPSCGYTAEEYGPGGIHHGIPYKRTIRKIRFHHLATVPRGRYEEASIRLNGINPKAGETTMFKFIQNILRKKADGSGDETVEEKGNLSPDSAVEIDGQSVKLNEIISGYKADAAAKAAAAPAKAAAAELDGETEIEFEGQKVKLNELVAGYSSNAARAAAERTAAEAAAAKEKTEKERKEQERLNAREAGAKSFRVLHHARNQPAPVTTPIAASAGTREEQISRGEELYGSGKYSTHGKN